MSATIHKLPAALSDSELLAEILGAEPAPCPICATREERAERYARLARDCEVRRARGKFCVVNA